MLQASKVPQSLLPGESENYQRIAAAIAFIRQHRAEHPSLTTVADHIGLSEHHFQRLFTQWAGISPKRFLQYLTVEAAKSNIARTNNLLDLSIDLGLSGPGRLHDLFVSIEAMSPGEFKSGADGLEIRYGVHATLFENVVIAATARGICSLQFWEGTRDAAQNWLALLWPKATLVEDFTVTQRLCDRIFNPVATQPAKPLTLLIKGTNFQLQVWRALLQIPPGGLTTYQTVAQLIDRPKAVRAVGTAIGKNPIGYLIPCHRVIRASGELGGYRWGGDRKSAILAWEAAQAAADA